MWGMFPVSRGDRLLSEEELQNVKQSPATMFRAVGQAGQGRRTWDVGVSQVAWEPSSPAWDVVLLRAPVLRSNSTWWRAFYRNSSTEYWPLTTECWWWHFKKLTRANINSVVGKQKQMLRIPGTLANNYVYSTISTNTQMWWSDHTELGWTQRHREADPSSVGEGPPTRTESGKQAWNSCLIKQDGMPRKML